jgi:lipoyl-dependent peroxiredoxin
MIHKRTGTAVWHGSGPKGSGALTSLSGALKDLPYNAHARFVSEDGRDGTNPEELIAAAHSGCFTLAFAYQISNAGHEAKELKTTATVSLEKQQIGWTVIAIHLDVEGSVPGMDAAKFEELANNAKKGCPISRLLAATPLTMNAKFLG